MINDGECDDGCDDVLVCDGIDETQETIREKGKKKTPKKKRARSGPTRTPGVVVKRKVGRPKGAVEPDKAQPTIMSMFKKVSK